MERNPKIERPQIAEITVGEGIGAAVRESAEDMYTAIDRAARKLERQAVRYRERRRRHRGPHEREVEALSAVGLDELAHEAEVEPGRVVKTKRHELKPMTTDEATLHMDMLHHDFYVFRDADSGGVHVVYRRRDGDFGLIVPTD
ncbi:MAG: HPF/RaiA family ribosome-associated protein [Thermoleophilia bacterium]